MFSMNQILSVVTIMILILLSMAFFTLLERKILGYSHLRKGPNKVSIFGLLQPISDAMKLFLKQIIMPSASNKILFFMAPSLGLFLALLMWMIYPFVHSSINFKFSVILFLCISSMNVYSTLIAGWTSNSKYSLLGALRSSAQTISYEVSMALILLSPIIIMNSFSIYQFKNFSLIFISLMPLFFIWLITLLAETNRTPFDMAEGESELVSGFNTEYSSGAFALIFMAEYTNILAMSMISSFIFFNILFMKMNILIISLNTLTILIISIYFIWTRTSFPRMRYDQLMFMAWKTFLPFSLIMIVINFILFILLVSFKWSIELLIQSWFTH